MKTRLLLNLVLICVIAALALVAFFEPGKEKPVDNPLTRIDESNVDAFTLQSHETIVFQRKNGHWWITSPLTAPANDIRVRQLLDVVKSDTDAQYPLNEEDLAKYELDKPSATLLVGDETIRFGGSDPIDMRRYVQVGDTLYLVRDDFSHHLNAGATDYVDKKLLPEDAKITSIAVPGAQATLSPEGKWTVQPPASDPSTAATALLNAWQSARAIDIKRLEAAPQGEKVRIGLADGSATDFVIVQRAPELVLGRPDWGIQYELVGEIAKQLLNQPVPEDENRTDEEEDQQHPEVGHDEDENDDSDDSDQEINEPDATEGEDLE